MTTPEGYYATAVDAEDFDRYADDERATVHEISAHERNKS